MTYKQFNRFCRALTATSHVKQWGDADVWKVGGKVFAIGGWEKLDQPAFTFKVPEADFAFMQDEAGIRPAPYMASRGMKWLQVFDASSISDGEIKHYLRESHRIVSLGLTKKLQKELSLNQRE